MALSKTTQNHEEIRQWAESRGAKPAEVASTESAGQTGILRLEFPGAPHANDSSLKEISWDEFFEKFDASGLALVYQEQTAEGEQSNFNKLIDPEATPKSAATKSSARKSPAKSTSAKAVTKTPAKKTVGTKAAAKKAVAKKVPTKKVPAKKVAVKKAAAKKSPVTKSAAKKSAAKKTPVKKALKKASSSKGATSRTRR